MMLEWHAYQERQTTQYWSTVSKTTNEWDVDNRSDHNVILLDIDGFDSDIEAIRLINDEDDTNMGRVELLYNGTWGTVCDKFWSYSDAKVACG